MLSNMPLQLTRACKLSVDVQRAGAARPSDERRPPRGPGSGTIDHHVTALAAERQGVRQAAPLGRRAFLTGTGMEVELLTSSIEGLAIVWTGGECLRQRMRRQWRKPLGTKTSRTEFPDGDVDGRQTATTYGRRKRAECRRSVVEPAVEPDGACAPQVNGKAFDNHPAVVAAI